MRVLIGRHNYVASITSWFALLDESCASEMGLQPGVTIAQANAGLAASPEYLREYPKGCDPHFRVGALRDASSATRGIRCS